MSAPLARKRPVLIRNPSSRPNRVGGRVTSVYHNVRSVIDIRMRVAKPVGAIVFVSLVVLLAVPDESSGHLPLYRSGGSTINDALEIPDIQVSYAIYAEFEQGTGTHFYSFPAEAGESLHFQLGVPTFDRFDAFAPEVLLIGPGLPLPDESAQQMLSYYSVALPPETGVLSWMYDGPMYDEEFEPFTQTEFWVRQTVDTTLDVEGTYYFMIALSIALHALEGVSDGTVYKYLFAPGVEEDFGVLDFVLIPYDWYSTKVFWEENPLVFMLPTYLTVIGGLAFHAFVLPRFRSVSRISDRTQKALFYSALSGALLMIGGGVNQTVFLVLSPLFSESPIGMVVLLLQSAAIVLGMVALRYAGRGQPPSTVPRLAVSLMVAVAALVIGAGLIVGPILVLGAILLDSWHSASPKTYRA